MRQFQTTAEDRRRGWGWTLLAIGILAVIAALCVRFVLPMLPSLREMDLSVDSFAQFMRDAGGWGVAGSICLMIVHSFVPFPAEFVAFANGLVYGPYWGVVITWVGAMLGAFAAFGLARWLGRPFVETIVPIRHRVRLDNWAAKSGWRAVLLSRFLPVISFNLVNYAAGLTTVSLFAFTLATGLGILPVTVVMVTLGHNMSSMSWQSWVGLAVGGLVLAGAMHWAARPRGRETERSTKRHD
ncbi:MAG: TVP38/TMEM64 family protein [Alphaproteobacteria bacterium]|nr:TVP38/TMEM64 family protein [Alphaproteobacteria bacterium]